jgi:hypothetical protein
VEPTDEPDPTKTPHPTHEPNPTPTEKPKCNKGEGNGGEDCDPGNNPDNGTDDENNTTPSEDHGKPPKHSNGAVLGVAAFLMGLWLNASKRNRMLLIISMLAIALLIAGCGGDSNISKHVANKGATETFSQAVDGSPLVIEEFTLTIQNCVTQDDDSQVCTNELSHVSRDTFNRYNIGDVYP